MRLTVLTDNHTYIDRYYLGEPALCFYLEDGDQKILFDTGYSDTAVKNAEAMGIDLSGLTMIIFSHGHNDHTGGLEYLPESIKGIPLYAHPVAFAPKAYDGISVGSTISEEELSSRFQLCLSAEKAIKYRRCVVAECYALEVCRRGYVRVCIREVGVYGESLHG